MQESWQGWCETDSVKSKEKSTSGSQVNQNNPLARCQKKKIKNYEVFIFTSQPFNFWKFTPTNNSRKENKVFHKNFQDKVANPSVFLRSAMQRKLG